MLIWVLQLLLNSDAGFAATKEEIGKMQCQALSVGVALGEHAATAYAELVQSLDPNTLRADPSVARPNNLEIQEAIIDFELNWLTEIKRDPELTSRRWASSSDQNSSQLAASAEVTTFFMWVDIGIYERLQELKAANTQSLISGNFQISLVRLAELERQSRLQPIFEFFRNHDISTIVVRELIDSIHQGTLDPADRSRAQEVADQIIQGRLSRPLVPPGTHSLGTIISTTKSLSIFEQNQLLPLPILTIDFSGDFLLGLENFEPSVRRWIREIRFYDEAHTGIDLMKMRWQKESLQVQRAYQNARNTKGKSREKLVIDWVFHTIVAKSDSRFAQGPRGIRDLIARIGDETEEQISFTNYILPKLRSPSALGPSTTLVEVLDARDALLIAFEQEL